MNYESMKCDPRNVSGSFETGAPIFAMWSKVRQMKFACAGEIAVCNAIFYMTVLFRGLAIKLYEIYPNF